MRRPCCDFDCPSFSSLLLTCCCSSPVPASPAAAAAAAMPSCAPAASPAAPTSPMMTCSLSPSWIPACASSCAASSADRTSCWFSPPEMSSGAPGPDCAGPCGPGSIFGREEGAEKKKITPGGGRDGRSTGRFSALLLDVLPPVGGCEVTVPTRRVPEPTRSTRLGSKSPILTVSPYLFFFQFRCPRRAESERGGGSQCCQCSKNAPNQREIAPA